MGRTYDQEERDVVRRIESYVRKISAFTDCGTRTIRTENVMEFEGLVWGFVKTIMLSEHVRGLLGYLSRALNEAILDLDAEADRRDVEDPNGLNPRLCWPLCEQIVRGFAIISRTQVHDLCETNSTYEALHELATWEFGMRNADALLYFEESTVNSWALYTPSLLSGWLDIHAELERNVPKAWIDAALEDIARQQQ